MTASSACVRTTVAPTPTSVSLSVQSGPITASSATMVAPWSCTPGRSVTSGASVPEDLEAVIFHALEKTPVRSRTYVRYSELFRWPLGLMLVMLATELVLLAWKGPLP